jgi:hypothetical protein
VPVRYSAYKQTALKNYQAVVDPSKPLAGMTKAKQDQTWVKICEETKKAVNLFSPAVIATPSAKEKPRSQTHDQTSPQTQAVGVAAASETLLSLSPTLELPSDELTKQRIIAAMHRGLTGTLPACTVGLEQIAVLSVS